MSRHIVITGASAGIGAATARRLHGTDRLSLGARRVERLADVVPDAFHHPLDVTDEASVEAFLDAARAAHGPIDALVNNAGLARGVERVADADGRAWREMIETNVFGTLHVTRRVLPEMIDRKQGDILMIGSIAGHEAYPGGSVYCGSKRALQSICKALRHELLGTGIRVMSVDPGMVETEFSIVRFKGDRARADQVYAGTRPLSADDVASCVQFALSCPPHVTIEDLLVMPTDQAAATSVHRS